MSKGTTPDAVLAFTGPTTEYLCPLSANKYGIEFLDFEVKDYDSGKSLFKVSKDPDAPPLPADIDPELEDQIRTIRYTFPPEFLSFQTVRTSYAPCGPLPHPGCPSIRERPPPRHGSPNPTPRTIQASTREGAL
mmetsp:Transcript_57694/g.182700  ORF Transcript_57694/g.182700 Transcript_57694/m.182700 type:complete len:134 (+) Transcript_57694:1471-1872(+)